MIYMTVTFTIAAGREREALKLLRNVMHHARTEPGVLEIQAFRSRKEVRRIFVYLRFTDEAAVDTHRDAGYYGKFVMTDLYNLVEDDNSPDVETYEPLFKKEAAPLQL